MWGSNLQSWDQESYIPLTEPAQHLPLKAIGDFTFIFKKTLFIYLGEREKESVCAWGGSRLPTNQGTRQRTQTQAPDLLTWADGRCLPDGAPLLHWHPAIKEFQRKCNMLKQHQASLPFPKIPPQSRRVESGKATKQEPAGVDRLPTVADAAS